MSYTISCAFFIMLSLLRCNQQKPQGRRQSILPKTIEEKINQESTPLKDNGEVGPPQIVDIFDIHSAVEGLEFYSNICLFAKLFRKKNERVFVFLN